MSTSRFYGDAHVIRLAAARVIERKLNKAASYAKIQTLELLSSVRWITTDVEAYINSLNLDEWTPHKLICRRRWNNEDWAQWAECEPDEDPEQTYQAFMELVQKFVDDYYGFDAHGDHEGEEPTKRMVAVPRYGSKKFLDIVEESFIEEVFESDTEASDTEDSSDGEEWDDAPEYREEPAESVTDNRGVD
ncbi:MAG: hypothetical protein Q9200_000878 [Gallowayella weberi]